MRRLILAILFGVAGGLAVYYGLLRAVEVMTSP
jgi:phage shock protein PspC (stress-responsive transcriptional regulator)